MNRGYTILRVLLILCIKGLKKIMKNTAASSNQWSSSARPDIAELDVFLGQHILLTLEQHFNPKI